MNAPIIPHALLDKRIRYKEFLRLQLIENYLIVYVSVLLCCQLRLIQFRILFIEALKGEDILQEKM